MDQEQLLKLSRSDAQKTLAAMPDRQQARALAFMYEAKHDVSLAMEPAVEAARPKRKPSLALTLAVVIGGLIAVFMIVLMTSPYAEPQDPVERIKDACERQYGVETPRAVECRMQLSLERLAEAEREKLHQARREAR